MKKILAISLALAMVLPAQAGRRKDAAAKVGIDYLNANFALYDSLQKEIHSYAEPGYQEYRSSEALIRHFEANGFTVERGVAGIPTAFVATFGSGKPVIGILGEYDALPGMSQDTSAFKNPARPGAAGHACGHNLIATGPASGAVAVSKWLSQGHQGTVKYFGCPAEEGGGGKAYMTRGGCFDGCDLFLDFHPGMYNEVSLTAGLANVRVRFSFSGISAHASVSPWNGRSALDAVEAFNHMMNLMREHVPDHTRIHYIIDNGGQAPNVVPNTASTLYYIRAPKAETVLSILERAIKAAEGAALGTGTTMSYEVINGNYEKLVNRCASQVLLSSLRKVGGVILDEREKAYCAEIMKNSGWEVDLSNFEAIPEEIDNSFSGGSSDVGNVSQMGPLASLDIACVVRNAGLHSWQLASMAGTTIGTKALLVVGKTFYLTAIEYYTNPAALKAAWDEYRSERGSDFKFVPLMGDRTPPLDYCVGK